MQQRWVTMMRLGAAATADTTGSGRRGSERLYTANSDQNTVVEVAFEPDPMAGRFVRIEVVAWPLEA